MKINWKTVTGTITVLGIVGVTAYCIKKSLDAKKQAAESITVEEAMAEVQAKKELEEQLAETSATEEYEEDEDLPFIVAKPVFNIDEIEKVKPTIIEGGELDFEYNFVPVLDRPFSEVMTEEDNVLNYESNSKQARMQFIRMELAEWGALEETYSNMLHLFKIDFQPTNDGDWALRNTILDYRVQFFGFESKWSKEITMADVILHYARALQFECDETVSHWVEHILDYTGLDAYLTPEEREDKINRLNNHTFFNQETNTYGPFGLSEDEFRSAQFIAGRNIDDKVTYDIEFNEFLKTFL